MKKLRHPLLISLTAGIFLFTGCTLDEPSSIPYQYPITLEASKNYSLVELNWNPVHVTGFKEYIILQSIQEIPDAPEPEVSQQVSVLRRIDDANVTAFTASSIIFFPKVCYKLYAAVDDRFLQSGNVCVERDLQLLNGFYDRVAHEDGKDEMILFDRLNQMLTAYNYKNGTIISTISTDGLNFPIMDLSTWNGSTDLFAFDQSPGRLRKYPYPLINAPVEKFFNGVLFCAKPFREFVFVAVEEFGSSFKVLNRSNMIQKDAKDGHLGNRVIAAFEGDPAVVLDISEAHIHKYAINQSGQAVLMESKMPGILQPSQLNASAHGGQLFITGRNGTIVDRDANILGSLSNSQGAFMILVRLTADEKKTAYIISDNISVRLEMADLSNFQDIHIEASYTLPQANYSDLILDGDIMYIIGVSFDSGQAQSFVLKYPMP